MSYPFGSNRTPGGPRPNDRAIGGVAVGVLGAAAGVAILVYVFGQHRQVAPSPLTQAEITGAGRISIPLDGESRFRVTTNFVGPNGQATWRCLIDTGAPDLTLDRPKARALGFDNLKYIYQNFLPTRQWQAAAITLRSVTLAGRFTLRDMPAIVDTEDECLIGIPVLRQMRVSIRGSVMELSW